MPSAELDWAVGWVQCGRDGPLKVQKWHGLRSLNAQIVKSGPRARFRTSTLVGAVHKAYGTHHPLLMLHANRLRF